MKPDTASKANYPPVSRLYNLPSECEAQWEVQFVAWDRLATLAREAGRTEEEALWLKCMRARAIDLSILCQDENVALLGEIGGII